MLINAIIIENDFNYYELKFKKNQLLTVSQDNSTLIKVEVDNEKTYLTPICLKALSDVVKKDFVDTVRFVFDNHKNISILRFKP